MKPENPIESFGDISSRFVLILGELAYIDIQKICWDDEDSYSLFEELRDQFCCDKEMVQFYTHTATEELSIPQSLVVKWQLLDAKIGAYLPDLSVDQIWNDLSWLEISKLAKDSLIEWSLLDNGSFPAKYKDLACFEKLDMVEKCRIALMIMASNHMLPKF